MKKRELSKYYLIGLIFVILLLAFFIIRPFIGDILTGIVISYIFYPLYKKLSSKINKTLSAFLICGLIVLTISIPLIILGNAIYGESFKVYRDFKDSAQISEAINGCKENSGFVCKAVSFAGSQISNPVFKGSIEKI